MKTIQEENMQQIQSLSVNFYKLDKMSCIFFILGMFICAYGLHHFIL